MSLVEDFDFSFLKWLFLMLAILSIFGPTIARYTGVETKLPYFSMMLAFLSLAIACISGEIAQKSLKIAKDSDKKMIVNANESFLKIADVFEDKRIQLLQHPDWLGIEATIWKCQTYLDRAIKLKKSAKIDVENQDKLFDQFDYLINRTGLPWGTDVIKPNDFKNIHKMEKEFLKLDLTDESKEKLKRIKEYVKKYEKEK